MNFDKYIFRSHMVGQIISVPKPLTEKQSETLHAYRERVNGNGKPLTEKQEKDWHSLENKLNESKKFKLTDSAKSTLNNLVFEHKYKRQTKLDVKFFEKGLEKEKESRDLLSEVLGIMLTSDDERKTNYWVTGKRDIKNNDVIIDIKTAWSYESFNKHLLDGKPNEVYLRQLDCYMDLWNVKESLLCHVLVDTPFNLIDDEISRMNWKYNLLDINGQPYDDKIQEVKDIITNHIYSRKALEDYCGDTKFIIDIDLFDDFVEIPKSERVHMIPHSFDPVRIEQRNECIKLAREYMNTVQPINNIVKL